MFLSFYFFSFGHAGRELGCDVLLRRLDETSTALVRRTLLNYLLVKLGTYLEFI